MPHKDVGKRKLLIKTMPMLGAAGLSLAIGTSAAIGSINPDPITSARVAEPMMDEEQISDISLATFHLFDGNSGSPPRDGEPQSAKAPVGQASITLRLASQSIRHRHQPGLGRPVRRINTDVHTTDSKIPWP
jgi:hypothetical protein